MNAPTTDLVALRKRIAEAAVKITPDYPGIGTAGAWEQISAIESCYEGTRLANDDLRAIATDLLAACANALVCVAGRDGWGALEAVLEAAIHKAKA